ncbi:MAG: hypothetical protein KAI67_06050 [Candidatus Pacebacteria bacterium]|nr:hypothetical protein [Candidatus Paceibacterota bacterium]
MKKLFVFRQLFNGLTIYGVTALSFLSAKAAIIDPGGGDKPSDTMSGNFRENIVHIINYILGFLGLLAVAFVIYAGFLLVTAGGEEDNLNKGKKIITYAAIGIVIILLSYGIVNVIVGAGGDASAE